MQFESANDFYEFIDFFDEDERTSAALPLLLDQELEGFGFALACDFVTGLGYENFSKPDVHIKDIFEGIGLSSRGSSDYEVFKAVARVARNSGVTPYNVDRLFWHIGSGYIHGEPHVGNKISSRKNEFIEVAGPSWVHCVRWNRRTCPDGGDVSAASDSFRRTSSSRRDGINLGMLFGVAADLLRHAQDPISRFMDQGVRRRAVEGIALA